MKLAQRLATGIIILLFTVSCVTTENISGSDVAVPEDKAVDIEAQREPAPPVENGKTEAPSPDKTEGILYSSRSLASGPLLLGSKEHMTGPVMEFSLLYSIYFPLSGIEFPFSNYKPGEGTRWQVEAEKLGESVFFERALLSVDDEDKSWWLFRVEGDGFERVYEFLIDADWTLLEMRYSRNGTIETYTPYVDEENDLSAGQGDLSGLASEKVKVETALGSIQADHIVMDDAEYWLHGSTPGRFVRTIVNRDGDLLLRADLIEVKKGYETELDSY